MDGGSVGSPCQFKRQSSPPAPPSPTPGTIEGSRLRTPPIVFPASLLSRPLALFASRLARYYVACCYVLSTSASSLVRQRPRCLSGDTELGQCSSISLRG